MAVKSDHIRSSHDQSSVDHDRHLPHCVAQCGSHSRSIDDSIETDVADEMWFNMMSDQPALVSHVDGEFRAQAMTHLQHTYGNQHTQHVVQAASHQPVSVQRQEEDYLRGVLPDLDLSGLGQAWDTITGGVGGAIGAASSGLQGARSAWGGGARSALGDVIGGGVGWGESLLGGVMGAGSSAWGGVEGAGSALSSGFEQAMGGDILGGIVSGIGGAGSSLWEGGSGAYGSLSSGAGEASRSWLGGLASAGSNLWGGATGAAESLWGGATGAVGSLGGMAGSLWEQAGLPAINPEDLWM